MTLLERSQRVLRAAREFREKHRWTLEETAWRWDVDVKDLRDAVRVIEEASNGQVPSATK